jgi:anti-anti-sigma regulatory factor
MNPARINPKISTLVSAGELTELVRGCEQDLLARFSPLVCRQDVTLDLGPVKRIDAAGIAALISLYGGALQAHHRFSVANLAPHVTEVLKLVGLEGILTLDHSARKSYSALRFVSTYPQKRLSTLQLSSRPVRAFI